MLLTVVMREGKRKFQSSEKNFITLFLAREGVAITPKPFPTGKKKKSTCSLTAVLIFRSYPQEAGNLGRPLGPPSKKEDGWPITFLKRNNN